MLRFDVWNIFEHQTRRFRCLVPQHVVKLHDVWAAKESLKDFGFSINLLLAHRLQNLDHTWLIVVGVDTLEDFGVLAAT